MPISTQEALILNGYLEFRKKTSKKANSFNEFFNHVEQVKRFELLPDEWTIDSGELTPTLKLKRKVIMEKYKNAIERIYK